MMRRATGWVAPVMALAVMAAGCRERGQPVAHTEESSPAPGAAEPSTLDSTGMAMRDTTRDATLEPGALGTVSATPVTQWAGAGDRPFEVAVRIGDPTTALVRRFGTITLRTSLRTRTADLGQYPCTSCHLGRRIAMADDRISDAHQNIRSAHPVQTGGLCSTCHSADNVELLALESGERATLEHTYRVCAQCHFKQAEAWAGGGHGKRLDGWQGRRVVMGCADCHDPHNPGLEPRIPFRAPRLERPRGGAR